MRRKRLIKKIVSMAFAILLIVVGGSTVAVKLIDPAFPTKTLMQGLGFGAVGAAMLILLKNYDVNHSPFDPYPPKVEEGDKPQKPSADAAARQESAGEGGSSAGHKRRDANEKKRVPPYPIDPKAPYGSKENPMVVGMPEYSSTLVYDQSRGCWILTDGLGNGWIR